MNTCKISNSPYYRHLHCYGRPAQQMRTLYFCPVVLSIFLFLA